MYKKAKHRDTHYYRKDAAALAEEAMFSNPIASANDCTGITPTIPETEEEAMSYCDIADIPVTSLDGASKYKRAK